MFYEHLARSHFIRLPGKELTRPRETGPRPRLYPGRFILRAFGSDLSWNAFESRKNCASPYRTDDGILMPVMMMGPVLSRWSDTYWRQRRWSRPHRRVRPNPGSGQPSFLASADLNCSRGRSPVSGTRSKFPAVERGHPHGQHDFLPQASEKPQVWHLTALMQLLNVTRETGGNVFNGATTSIYSQREIFISLFLSMRKKTPGWSVWIKAEWERERKEWEWRRSLGLIYLN